MPNKGERRIDRVASLLKEVLSELLLFEVRDPRLRGVVVTRVQVTKDLSLCRVYYRCIEDEGADVLGGLKASAGFLRREMGQRVRLLRTPELQFFKDDLPEKVAKVEALIEKVSKGE